MNNLKESQIQIVVGVLLACLLLLVIGFGIRNKILTLRRLRKERSQHKSNRKDSLPSYEDCLEDNSKCPDYASVKLPQ